MYTVRRFQNFNPEIEKEAKAEQKAKAKAEEKQYKVHLEQLRKDNEEDVASSKLGVAPRGVGTTRSATPSPRVLGQQEEKAVELGALQLRRAAAR